MLKSAEAIPVPDAIQTPEKLNLNEFIVVNPSELENDRGEFIFDSYDEFKSNNSNPYKKADPNNFHRTDPGHWAEVVAAYCFAKEVEQIGANVTVRLAKIDADLTKDIDILIGNQEFVAIDLKSHNNAGVSQTPIYTEARMEVNIPLSMIKQAASNENGPHRGNVAGILYEAANEAINSEINLKRQAN